MWGAADCTPQHKAVLATLEGLTSSASVALAPSSPDMDDASSKRQATRLVLVYLSTVPLSFLFIVIETKSKVQFEVETEPVLTPRPTTRDA